MEYYFKVLFDEPHRWCCLVQAKDVIDAGTKGIDAFYNKYPGLPLNVNIVEVVRTDIDFIVT